MNTKKISAGDKCCNNCEYWKDSRNSIGCPIGTCLKGTGQRYCSDYCWRWEQKDGDEIVNLRRGNVKLSKHGQIVKDIISEPRFEDAQN